MENCTVQEITHIDEMIELCEMASKLKHTNSQNYDVDNMKRRWSNYKLFTKIVINNEVISFAGVYDYGKNLLRVADRLFTFPKYRQNYLSKSIANTLKPALDYIIPYHTKWALDKGFDCFFSIQELKKRNSIIRLTKQLDPLLGYRVLPDMYATCNPENPKCIQNISSTTNNVHLPKYPVR